MSEVRVNNLSNENNTGGPTLSGITTFSSPYFFVPPQGDTASRPSDCEPGSLRFNTDSAKLEYFRGNTIGWTEIEAELTAPLGGGTGSNTGLGVRGIVGAYNVSGDTIEFLTVSTLGNTQDFGDLTAGRNNPGQQVSNESKMLFMGGYTPSGWANIIDFITVASTGDASDFGDLTQKRMQQSSVNNKTRGITGGGQIAPNYSPVNTIDYVTIAQTGNAVDFGDTTNEKTSIASVSSSTRGIFGHGNVSPSYYAYADFVTMASTGNATTFGDISANNRNSLYGGGSSSTRGIFFGGYITTDIEFITMATTGNSQDFGDLTVARFQGTGLSSSTRDVLVGNRISPGSAQGNVMDYIEIATTGNALDFGDLSSDLGSETGYGGQSNGHGGLSG